MRLEAQVRRVPSENWSCPKRNKEAACTVKGGCAWRTDERRSGSKNPFADAAKTLDGEGTQSETAPLSEICTECPAVLPLSCVECCNIMNLPMEYFEMLAVSG